MDNSSQWYAHHASDHRGNPVHAGKRTYQGIKESNYYTHQPIASSYGNSSEDYDGGAMSSVPRRTPPKGPRDMGAAKVY